MRWGKKYLAFSVALMIYVAAIAILLHQVYIYQKVYALLSELISHPTIEVLYQGEMEE